MEIHPEPAWEGLLEILKKQKCTALLIGTTDSGKSTLARYLIKKLTGEHFKVSLVDADIGQSILGLPGTISTKVFTNEKETENFIYERMFFVGSTNPAKKISLMIDGSKKMVAISREKSDITFVDTTGLISGEIGRALKIGKIRAIRPEHIIALQRHDEVEHILNLAEDIHIHRITPSHMAKMRDRVNRVRSRKKRCFDYFSKTKVSEFILIQNDVGFFYNGKTISLIDTCFKDGTIIGLNYNDDTRALGVIVESNRNSIIFKSPIKSLKGINRVLFGDITI